MIVLDTHVWIWSVQADKRLSDKHIELLRQHEANGLGASAISLWEIALAVKLRRLDLPFRN